MDGFRTLLITALIASLASAAIPGETLAAQGGNGHANRNGVSAGGMAGEKRDSGVQKPMNPTAQAKHLEQENLRLRNQREILTRNQNRIAEMANLSKSSEQQVRNQQRSLEDEGVRLRDQQQLTATLHNRVQEQQRLLQLESNREKLKAMNFDRAQVQSQLKTLQEQRARLREEEKLALEERAQLQERQRLLAQQKSQLAEQERLLAQQQAQVEERVQLMTRQHETLQQRERLWDELEQEGS